MFKDLFFFFFLWNECGQLEEQTVDKVTSALLFRPWCNSVCLCALLRTIRDPRDYRIPNSTACCISFPLKSANILFHLLYAARKTVAIQLLLVRKICDKLRLVSHNLCTLLPLVGRSAPAGMGRPLLRTVGHVSGHLYRPLLYCVSLLWPL